MNNHLHSKDLVYPVLPLRDVVVFPNVVIPLYVGRARSLRAIEEALRTSGKLFLVTQRDASGGDPKTSDLYSVGTLALIKHHSKLSDGNMKLLVEGIERATLRQFISEDPFFLAAIEPLPYPQSTSEFERRLMSSVIGHFRTYLKLVGKSVDEMITNLELLTEPDKLVNMIATQIPFKLQDRQEILEISESRSRLEKLAGYILSEIEIIKIDRKIKGRVREQIEKSQRDYYLHEQLSAIHKELGSESDPRDEALDLEKKLATKKMPDAARERALKEIRRLKFVGANSAEASVIRTYIDLIIELPWLDTTEDHSNLEAAEKILNADHSGLAEIKERILEFLAVRMKVEHHRSPVLCLVGPPGTGKTSLARSIANALGRKFERISLGGVRDEAELRGHRRTYIGAMPGKILGAIRKAKTSNPVILLDEIDKMGQDYRGDPSAALLEILDPEQNRFFSDHYLDLDYDLSKVLFITTANLIDPLSAPLRDRMEIIRLSGYNDREKIEIAKKFLLLKEQQNHGLSKESFSLPDSSILKIIHKYTREAGVRNLQREISKICRKVVRENKAEIFSINEADIEHFLGVEKFRSANVESETNEIGVVTGLAWTASGGEVLTVEASVVPGKGKFQITGHLGNIMQESVKAALSYVRSKAKQYGLKEDFFATRDIHVHIPEGAIPKDGPSAGITVATAILSAILKAPVRKEVGMTGEITLRGRILPIGGLKEKVLAAERFGLRKVLYPFENERDRKEISLALQNDSIALIPVYDMSEVIQAALVLKDPSLEVRETRGSLAKAIPSIKPVSPDVVDLAH